jgi:hypothetical protein
MQWHAPCAATRPFLLLFSILCSGIVGTGEVRTADTLGSEFSGTHF